ncbi:MAG: bifunctional isocitrate dehydrogenase kinase/phosphatase, partial [Desulfobulbaceae bacterium]|nr:bifunctional isocitrate dehydrogenase kinase/phosphatase [Desulfobulbaceae bacterium]
MKENSNHMRPADLCAKDILKAFFEYQAKFKIITLRAKARFENRDWHGMKADAGERLDLYKKVVSQTVDGIRSLLNNRINDKGTWVSIKTVYSALSGELEAWELAETFFNSVTRKIFTTVGVDPQIEFVDTCTRTHLPRVSLLPYRTYDGDRSTPILMEAILWDYKHQVAYEDMQRDARLAAEKVDNHLRS